MGFGGRQLTGGAAIVEAARANGMTTIFGVPGVQTYPLFDALHGTDVELIVPRHEQAAAYMAMGYAKSTGRTGVFTVVPGPGVLNAAAALCTAMGNCAPLICLTGQVPSSFLGRGRGHLHELADQAATLRTLIKDAWRIDSASDASRLVNKAFRDAAGGRPGPIAVEMCWDTMAAQADAVIEPAEGALPEPVVDSQALDAAIRLLAAAKKPMIMCGAGAQHAPKEVELLAETLQAPVTAFRSGRGIVPEDHALGIASVAARELWDEVDVLIGVGSRLEMPYMRWGDSMRYERKPKGPKLIRIDIDPAEMQRLEPDVAIVADSATACRLLAERLRSHVAPDRARVAEIAAAKRVADAATDRIQPQAAFLRAIRAVLPRDGILVPELSQVGFATYTGAFPVLAPRTYISEGFQGTLGFGFPTALGAKVANRGKAGRVDNGGWRLHVRSAGARDGSAVRNRARDDRLQQPIVCERAARPANALRRPDDRLALAQPGLRPARRKLRRRGSAGESAARAAGRARGRARGGPARADRGCARSR